MHVTAALVDRIVELENENVVARLVPVAGRAGNPCGVFVERFGRAVACAARGLRSRLLNTALGVGPETDLDAVLRFYEAHGVEPAIEVVPGRLTEDLGAALATRGFAMVAFHAAMARSITADDAVRRGAGVIEIDPHGPEHERWVETYLVGFGHDPHDPNERANALAWRENASWRFYLAHVEGHVAGAGILDVRDGAALLGSACTLAEQRGRGVQRALIEARIGDAARMGCDLVAGGADFGSPSMRNQLRAGLELAFVRGIWVRPA